MHLKTRPVSGFVLVPTCGRAGPVLPGAAGWIPMIPRGSQTPALAYAAAVPVLHQK